MTTEAETHSSVKKLQRVPLVREFLSDHQRMSKLLLKTVDSLEAGDMEAAHKYAEALNEVGGAHIAYEEEELYPRISGEQLISETTREMYHEHQTAVSALKKLINTPTPDETTKREILAGLRTGIHHAEHCGSLVSLLAALPQPEQDESLAKLLAYRQQRQKWTDQLR